MWRCLTVLDKSFEGLKDFVETDLPIVEWRGEYFWVGEGDPPAGFETASGEMEISMIPAIRRSVCVGYTEHGPYSLDSRKGTLEFSAGAYRDPEDGVLPDSDKRYLKLVENPEVVKQSVPDVAEFLVHSKEQGGSICIRNICPDCPALSVCRKKIKVTS